MHERTQQPDAHRTMTAYEFTCAECAQVIEVNEPMREATLASGCPVCGAAVCQSDFEPQ